MSKVIEQGYFEEDKSGINSLAGFAYQIKVFAYYAFQLNRNSEIQFETIDDVNIKKVNNELIDDVSHNFICKSIKNGSNVAIQVKHTSITNDIAQQLWLNWILLEHSSYIVEKYILFTASIYGNKEEIFSISKKDLYDKVISSNKKSNATITKVKKVFQENYSEFEKVYDSICSKFQFVNIENLDLEIEHKAEIYFRKIVNNIIYKQRLNEFLQYITVRILESIEQKKAFAFSYSQFIGIVEDICSRFTIKITAPCYSEFKRLNKIDLKDSRLSSSREYIQLQQCGLTDGLIKQHLQYGMYYHVTTLKYMENNKIQKIEDIEETTFENFEMIKFALKKNYNDTPFNRLEEIKKQPNSYSENEQIKYGSSIHLTKAGVGEKQISWKDGI